LTQVWGHQLSPFFKNRFLKRFRGVSSDPADRLDLLSFSMVFLKKQEENSKEKTRLWFAQKRAVGVLQKGFCSLGEATGFVFKSTKGFVLGNTNGFALKMKNGFRPWGKGRLSLLG
jgi:hypothetical protein